MSVVLGCVGGSRMCRWFLDVSVVLRCVHGFWICRWFSDVSVVLECVRGFCQNLTKIKMCQQNTVNNFCIIPQEPLNCF